ncbi:DEAD/DEAH box helicase [Bradyrhizobium sp. Arg314]
MTTTLPPSGSDGIAAFESLAEPVRRWIWKQRWSSLRDVQAKAVPAILPGGDVIVSARTAAGKTEAALLPLLTRVLRRTERKPGFDILYVSPLKALINDQYRRLESLCEDCEVSLHRWHGDVSSDAKQRARSRPSGIVIITPESLEATLIWRGADVPQLFGALEAIVIDELHAFIGRERGMQLQSILTRIEIAAGLDRVDRIGLSATLGDMRLAADFLRPGGGDSVRLVEGKDEGNGLKLQVRGYAKPVRTVEADAEQAQSSGTSTVHSDVVGDIFRLLRGRSNLFFAGSRQRVEAYSDALREMCEQQGLPNEFFAHHGNLAKAEREDVEERLRESARPSTAIATSTLELGIDLGDVETVAQLGPGFSVSSLRQRLGRSGRRPGNPAIMRMFIIEEDPDRVGHPVDRLRLELVQAIAMVECMLKGWVEPPDPAGLHLSTLLHQTLSLIVQAGPLRAATAYKVLCGRGPFRRVSRDIYAQLLRSMTSADPALIEMSGDGELMLGKAGEQLTYGHEFYAVFETPLDYRVLHGSRQLGVLPLDHVVAPGQTLIFSGRRWRAKDVDDRARVILVEPTTAALPPTFGGDFGGVHDTVVAEMRSLLSGSMVPVYLDPMARRMLEDARQAFIDLSLDRNAMVPVGRGVYVFPWVGTRRLDTLAVALLADNFEVAADSHRLEVDDCSAPGLLDALQAILTGPTHEPQELAQMVAKPAIAKFDRYLSAELLGEVALAERLDIASLPAVIARILDPPE